MVVYGNNETGYILFEKSYNIVLPSEVDADQTSFLPKEIQDNVLREISSINPMQIDLNDLNNIIKTINNHSGSPKNLLIAKDIFYEIINFFKDKIISEWENKYKVYFKDIIESDFPAGDVSNSVLPNDMRRIVLKGTTNEIYLRKHLQIHFESLFFSYMPNLIFDDLKLLDIGRQNIVFKNTCDIIQIWLDGNNKFLLNNTKNEFKKILENCKAKKSEILEILNKFDTEILFDKTNQKSFYTFLYRFVLFYFQHKMIRDGINMHNHFIENKNTQVEAFLKEFVLTNQGKKVIDFCLQIDKTKVKIYTLKYFAKHYNLDKSVSNIEQRELDLHELWNFLLKTKKDRNGLREKDEKMPDELPPPCINLSFLTSGENGQYFDQKFLQFLS